MHTLSLLNLIFFFEILEILISALHLRDRDRVTNSFKPFLFEHLDLADFELELFVSAAEVLQHDGFNLGQIPVSRYYFEPQNIEVLVVSGFVVHIPKSYFKERIRFCDKLVSQIGLILDSFALT